MTPAKPVLDPPADPSRRERRSSAVDGSRRCLTAPRRCAARTRVARRHVGYPRSDTA